MNDRFWSYRMLLGEHDPSAGSQTRDEAREEETAGSVMAKATGHPKKQSACLPKTPVNAGDWFTGAYAQ